MVNHIHHFLSILYRIACVGWHPMMELNHRLPLRRRPFYSVEPMKRFYIPYRNWTHISAPGTLRSVLWTNGTGSWRLLFRRQGSDQHQINTIARFGLSASSIELTTYLAEKRGFTLRKEASVLPLDKAEVVTPKRIELLFSGWEPVLLPLEEGAVFGGKYRVRTYDLSVNSRLLCRLS